MRRSPRLLLCVLIVLVGACLLGSAGPASAAACKNQTLKPTKANLGKVERGIRCLLNHERTSRGMKSLKKAKTLRTAARRHSRSMVRKHYFDHTGADGSSPKQRMQRAGYRGHAFAENITYGTGPYATPRSVVSRWMNSTGHRRNILGGAYDHMGIGVWRGNPNGSGGITVTMTMGGR